MSKYKYAALASVIAGFTFPAHAALLEVELLATKTDKNPSFIYITGEYFDGTTLRDFYLSQTRYDRDQYRIGEEITKTPSLNLFSAFNPTINTRFSYDSEAPPRFSASSEDIASFQGNSFDFQIMDPLSGEFTTLNTGVWPPRVEMRNNQEASFGVYDSFNISGTINLTSPLFIENSPTRIDVDLTSSALEQVRWIDDARESITSADFFANATASLLTQLQSAVIEIPTLEYRTTRLQASFIDYSALVLGQVDEADQIGEIGEIGEIDEIDQFPETFDLAGFDSSNLFIGLSTRTDFAEPLLFINSEETQYVSISSINSRLELEYDLGLSGSITTDEIINTFVNAGQLPDEEIPGVFELPNNIKINEEDETITVTNGDGSEMTYQIGDSFLFDNTLVLEGVPVIYDPYVAVGYEYEITNADAGMFFASIEVPTIGGDNEFAIRTYNPNTGAYLAPITLLAGNPFDFTGLGFDVSRFIIDGISIDEMLDPNNTLAFPALLSFTDTGLVSVSQTVLTQWVAGPNSNNAVPEPSTWLLMLLGSALLLGRKTRARQRNVV